MSVAAWLILGFVAGLIHSQIVNRCCQSLVHDIIRKFRGALVGISLFSLFRASVSGSTPTAHLV
jgi:uncharacterized membrane protein YeaQ/YmgE (transglycosylase-associated protein family)